MTGLDLVLGLLGFLLTLAVFSYLLGDNLFFRTALYLLAGVSSGYAAALILTKVILPYLILPLGKPGTATFYLSLAPLLLSVVLLAILIPRRQQWAKLPLAFLVGVVAAVSLSGVLRGTLAPQLLAALQTRGHAAVEAIRLETPEDKQWREGKLPEALRKARAHPEWSSLNGRRVGGSDRQEQIDALAELLESGRGE